MKSTLAIQMTSVAELYGFSKQQLLRRESLHQMEITLPFLQCTDKVTRCCIYCSTWVPWFGHLTLQRYVSSMLRLVFMTRVEIKIDLSQNELKHLPVKMHHKCVGLPISHALNTWVQCGLPTITFNTNELCFECWISTECIFIDTQANMLDIAWETQCRITL